jgi:hypothetical protein
MKAILAVLTLIAVLEVRPSSSAFRLTADAPPACVPTLNATTGNPRLVVILADGAPGSESGGAYNPIAAAPPRRGVPQIRSYCPVDPSGHLGAWARVPGLADSLARWSELGHGGARSGACTKFGSWSNCLTGTLAALGAVLMPYSYAGASFVTYGSGRAPEFVVNAYGPRQSAYASPNLQLRNMATEVASIHRVWPDTMIALIGHSHGGEVAQLFWQCERGMGTMSGPFRCPPAGLRVPSSTIAGVLSLDSPVNGIKQSSLARGFYGAGITRLWAYDWSRRGHRGRAVAKADGDGSYTAVGTADDPAFSGIANYPNAGIQSQLALQCRKLGSNPAIGDAKCRPIAGIENLVSPCKADQAIGGVTGHDVVKLCPAVISTIRKQMRRFTQPEGRT